MAAPKGNKFAKNQGRPKGVPNKATAELRAIAGKYTTEAVEILIGIARDSDSDAAKVSACRELLDRAHGKSRQPITGDEDAPVVIKDVTDVKAKILRAIPHDRLEQILADNNDG